MIQLLVITLILYVSQSSNTFILGDVYRKSIDTLSLLPSDDIINQYQLKNNNGNTSSANLIPRNLWIAVKDRKDELPGHIINLFERNPSWTVHVCDNICKDNFINVVYNGTSIQWVYNRINPVIGASKADIWRYSVLYLYGGLYLDDDSDIRTPLDEIIKSKDHMIMSEEGASSLGDCYIPSYHLSDAYAFNKYTNASNARYYDGVTEHKDRINYPVFFHGNTLINWAIFVRPHHPLMLRVMENIVDIIKAEYFRLPYIHMTRWDVKWKMVMCSTGFTMTYTLREMLLEVSKDDKSTHDWLPSIYTNNFAIFGGRVKAIWTGADPNHYMKLMEKKHIPLLHEFAPVTIENTIEYLNNNLIMGDAGKAVYLVVNGHKRLIPDYETFLLMNFTSGQIKHVQDKVFLKIPDAEPMPSLMQGSAATSTTATTTTATATTIATGTVKRSAVDKLYLKQLQEDVNNKTTIGCWGDDYSGSRDDLVKGTYSEILNNQPVMIFPMCLRLFQLGNTLGYYFNDMSCAIEAGAHFVGVKKKFELIEPEGLSTKGDDMYAFFCGLPDLVLNHNAVDDVSVLKSNLKSRCNCHQYCWENSQAPWLKHVETISEYLFQAIDAYLSVADTTKGTVLSNVTDLYYLGNSSGSSGSGSGSVYLPIIPDAAIQYRCGDNIGFGKTRYGLLPFYSIAKKIPPAVKTIYVMADSPGRQLGHPYSSRCGVILEALHKYLIKSFPAAIIVMKRGGDQFLDYARLAYAKTTICSASTFCLWPAVANKGRVYFPLTPLVANAWEIQLAPNISTRFNWIVDAEIIKDFKQFKPWDAVITALSNEPTPTATPTQS